MAMAKSHHQQKNMPSFYMMVTVATFIAFCLLVVWVFSSSSEEQLEIADATVSMKSSPKEEIMKTSPIFEDSPGDNVEESNHNTSEDSDLNVEEEKETIGNESQSTEDPNAVLQEGNSEVEEAKEPPKDEDLSQKGAQLEVETENKEIPSSWDTQLTESKEEKEKEEQEKKEEKEREKEEKEKEKAEKEAAESSKEEEETVVGTTKNESPAGGEIKSVVMPISSSDSQSSKDGDSGKKSPYEWKLCHIDVATDFIPCLDNKKAIKMLPSTKHYEHRERHCPEEPPTCLVSLPQGYRSPIPWPQSRNEVWYNNVPHPGLVSYKKDQNWVKKSGDKLIFPGGGTQFKHGAPHYIDFIQEVCPDIAWGKHTRVILDVGCGVASFGGYLLDRDVVAMSLAPKDEHEAQVQLALERGIPAIVAVMGTQRLPFPSKVYDVVHCARCRVPWHIEGGKLLLELNRVLRPGGYFVWSATPVYWKGEEDVSIWKAMSALTASMCWNLLARTTDSQAGIGVAIFKKPTSNDCYENRKKSQPPICDGDDNPDAAWYVPMTACLHKVQSEEGLRAAKWPVDWPQRSETVPTWLNNAKGLYGKPAAADFQSDMEHWRHVVDRSYSSGVGINWSKVRNVMDMRAGYGGFAAALVKKQVWVMNVVPTDAPDTLPIIFDRGFLGMYHDWCESLSTYPRTYDLLHADHLFSKLKKRCNVLATVVEMDRILRPDGWAIFRDKTEAISEIEGIVRSLNWEVRSSYTQDKEALLVVQKKFWRPES